MNTIIIYTLTILVLIHSYKFRGLYKTLIFFFGAILVGGYIENFASISGSYYYPKIEFILFYNECPFDICLGWFIISYCCGFFSHILIYNGQGSFPAWGIGSDLERRVDRQYIKMIIFRSAFAAYIAVNFDFFMDPVAVENEWWIWQTYNYYILGVPLTNYIGWFLIVFWFLFFYDLIINYFKDSKNLIISGVWVLGTLGVTQLTGFILNGFNRFLSDPMIRNGGFLYPEIQLTPEKTIGVLITLLLTAILASLIIFSSKAPNTTPEPRPSKRIWKILPSIIMLTFWATILIAAFLTSPLMVFIGFIFEIFFLGICVYIIINKNLNKVNIKGPE